MDDQKKEIGFLEALWNALKGSKGKDTRIGTIGQGKSKREAEQALAEMDEEDED